MRALLLLLLACTGSSDKDGSKETDEPSDTTSTTDFTDVEGETVDYCHLQYPCALTLDPGERSATMYAWVYDEGVTAGAGAGAGIEVEVGVGPDGSTPDASWDWGECRFNVDKGNNDEYGGAIDAPATSGSYDYAFRVRKDGGPWLYCDRGDDGQGGCGTGSLGSDDGYAPEDAGQLTVR